MTESAKGFQRLIEQLPKTFTVLDVGCGGLQGENTTEYLAEHFGAKNILGICKADHEVERYQAIRAEKKLPPISILSVDFYELEFKPPMQFDLVVLDMNIENNLKNDWSNEGLRRVNKLVKDGGYLINYVMLTDDYGDEKTPEMIRGYWANWWRTKKLTMKEVGLRLTGMQGWEVFAFEKEERRKYILWIMLKKTSGL